MRLVGERHEIKSGTGKADKYQYISRWPQIIENTNCQRVCGIMTSSPYL